MMHRFQPQSPRVSHCTREQIEALEDGELSKREERRMLRHLESCASCRSERLQNSRALSHSRLALAQHPRIAAPRDFDAQVWQKIEARQQHAMPLSRWSTFFLLPIPRLLSSAMFGLLAALAFGRLADLKSAPVDASMGIVTSVAALPSTSSGASVQKRHVPQVLAAQPKAAPARRS